jgi:hypothetical protein
MRSEGREERQRRIVDFRDPPPVASPGSVVLKVTPSQGCKALPMPVSRIQFPPTPLVQAKKVQPSPSSSIPSKLVQDVDAKTQPSGQLLATVIICSRAIRSLRKSVNEFDSCRPRTDGNPLNRQVVPLAPSVGFLDETRKPGGRAGRKPLRYLAWHGFCACSVG